MKHVDPNMVLEISLVQCNIFVSPKILKMGLLFRFDIKVKILSKHVL